MKSHTKRILATTLSLAWGLASLANAISTPEGTLIYQRYKTYLVGNAETFDGPLGEAAMERFLKDCKNSVRAAKKFDYTKDLDQPFRSTQNNRAQLKADTKIYSFLLERQLPHLAYAYHVGGSKNPYYRNPEVLELYTKTLQYLHQRGIRTGMTFHNNDQRMQMKGAPQPGPGMANLVKMELRMGSLCQSFLLMREHIKDAKLVSNTRALIQHLEMLGQTSGHVRYYEPRVNPKQFENLVQSDAIQNYADTALVSAIIEEDPKRQQMLLKKAQQVYTDSLKVIPGWADTIKPDFVGYHHRGIYGNAYTGGFIPQASFGVYLLKDTPYAVSPESVENLKQLTLTYRLYCQKYAMPFGIRGRMPLSTNMLKTTVFAGILTQSSRLGLDNPQMQGVFARLWNADEIQTEFLFSGGRGKPYRGFYTLNMLDQLLKQAPTAEADPQGFWFKPYGGLALHRRAHWLAAVKGYSRYLWDYENGRPGTHENPYGDYLSHGSLSIFSKGSPVNEVASGYDLDRGWDWYRFPGTTAVHFPQKYHHTKRHRSANGSPFLGGASADQQNGLMAMVLNQSHSNHGPEINLKAHKSYFFADNMIVMLGSNISGGDGKNAVETTLFQSILPEQESSYTLRDSASGLLTDLAGNQYYIPEQFRAQLRSHHGPQTMPNRKDQKVTAQASLAWFDHGLAPKQARYHATILIPDTKRPEQAQQLAKTPQSFYQVLAHDNDRHSIYFPQLQTSMHALFTSGNVVQAPHLLANTRPCVVAIKQSGQDLHLSISPADLGLIPEGKSVGLELLRDIPRQGLLYAEPKLHQTGITLKGHWQLPAEQAKDHLHVTYIPAKNQTEIQTQIKGGERAEIRLVQVRK